MRVIPVALTLLTAAPLGCFRMRGGEPGGDVDVADVSGPRRIRLSDIAVDFGYEIRVVATGLTFPTGVAFDDAGKPYVIESGYSYGETVTEARLLGLDPAGQHKVIATSKNGPWNGVAFHQGAFYVAEGGAISGNGKIIKITLDGQVTTLVEGLPSAGDHHTNGPVVAPDGTVYFGQGSATNSGFVGEDSFDFGWLKRHPQFHDTPCKDVKLTDQALESKNPLVDGKPTFKTSAYSTLGTAVPAGTVIPGKVPCSGAVMKVASTGGTPELVAWGFRNPFGLAFDPMGRLYVTDNAHDERGSRPVWGAPDLLWRVDPGAWYGWPDYSGNDPIAKPRYKRPGYPEPKPVLAESLRRVRLGRQLRGYLHLARGQCIARPSRSSSRERLSATFGPGDRLIARQAARSSPARPGSSRRSPSWSYRPAPHRCLSILEP